MKLATLQAKQREGIASRFKENDLKLGLFG